MSFCSPEIHLPSVLVAIEANNRLDTSLNQRKPSTGLGLNVGVFANKFAFESGKRSELEGRYR